MSKKLSKTRINNIRESIIENISSNPTNLQAAFRLTANQHKVKSGYIQYLWYSQAQLPNADGSKSKGMRSGKALFLTKTSKGVIINVKHSPVIKETKTYVTLGHSLIETEDMSDQEKIGFFDLIVG